MKTIIFRCDASPMVDIGHVMRCIALAQELRAYGYKVVFAMRDFPAEIEERIIAEGSAIVSLNNISTLRDDAIETSRIAVKYGFYWVVIDGPLFSKEWEDSWSCISHLLRIEDDSIFFLTNADILVNPNLTAYAQNYSNTATNCKLLLGPDYFMLRNEFRQVDRSCQKNTQISVLTGGADPSQTTELIFDALNKPNTNHLCAEFVIGLANPRRNSLVTALSPYTPRLVANFNPPNMAKILAKGEMAITDGGDDSL